MKVRRGDLVRFDVFVVGGSATLGLVIDTFESVSQPGITVITAQLPSGERMTWPYPTDGVEIIMPGGGRRPVQTH